MEWSQYPIPVMRLEARFGDRIVPAFEQRPSNIWAMVAEAAKRNPDGEALIFGRERLTWREVAQKSMQAAAGFKEIGLKLTKVPKSFTVHKTMQRVLDARRKMIEDGLFQRFPCDAVFALHNLPGLPIGHFALRSGPIMAGVEDFTIRIEGKGGHGGIPHKTIDPIPAIAEIVLACQTIVARAIDPLAAAVVSVTRLSAGASNNVVPDSAQIGGTFRYLDSATGDVIRSRLTALTRGVAAAHGVTGHFDCFDAYPPTVNSDAETAFCAATLRAFVGAERLDESTPPLMGAEDFSFMLNRRPGCYAFIGNGDGAGSCMIHNPRYDFNDASIPIGAEYFVRLVHAFCARSGR